MKILVSESKVKLEDTSVKIKVESGKATKTKPAMATILASTKAKKNLATVTFKPTKEATIEKPKYEALLKRSGKNFRMKNAAEIISALRVLGFESKDGKPIRDFFAGRITAAQFKKDMGTKSYTHKDDAKAAGVIKLINATKFPASGKGKITSKMIDAVFASYQTQPFANESFVKQFLKAATAFNEGKATPAQIRKVTGIFAKRAVRNAKLKATKKAYEAVTTMMNTQSAKTPSGKTPSEIQFPNAHNSRAKNINKITHLLMDHIESGKLTKRQATSVDALFKKIGEGKGAEVDFAKIEKALDSDPSTSVRLFNQAVDALAAYQKASGVEIKSDKVAPKAPKAKLLTGLHKGMVAVTGLTGMGYTFQSGNKKAGNYTSFGEVFLARKAVGNVIKEMAKSPQFNIAYGTAIKSFVAGNLTPSAFAKQFNAIKSSGSKAAAPKTPKTPKADDAKKFSSREWTKIRDAVKFRWRTPQKVAQVNALFSKVEAGTASKHACTKLVSDWAKLLKTNDPVAKAQSINGLPASVRKRLVAIISDNKTTPTARSGKQIKDAETTTAKVDGNKVTDGTLSVELPDDSKLTPAEANKIMGYMTSLIASGEVAKAQCTRALKDLASGEMTPQMKKRWLARVGGSTIRPVPRKLVNILRDGSTGEGRIARKTAAKEQSRRSKSAKKPSGGLVRPMSNSTPTAIAKAVVEAGFKGVLAARGRGDLIEVYNKSGDGSVVWSWNRKTQKAIDYTASQINHMYSTLDLESMTHSERVGIVKDTLMSMTTS